MQKPDDNGFIHVNWPSKSIPHGGVFHSKVVEPSKEQQKFLKVLLEESKLAIAQRRKGEYVLRQHDKVQTRRDEVKTETPVVRPRTSRRRSLSAIRESGIYSIDEYRPVKKGEDREKLKDNLVHQMAYGDKVQQSPPLPRQKHQIRLPTKKEQWNDLVTQIRERADWLAEMEYIGQGAQYRELVNGQIAERMKALDALGIDSECSTARSTAEVSRKPTSELSVRSTSSGGLSQSRKSSSSCNKQISNSKPSKVMAKEENVADYEKLTPLQFSPRRRV